MKSNKKDNSQQGKSATQIVYEHKVEVPKSLLYPPNFSKENDDPNHLDRPSSDRPGSDVSGKFYPRRTNNKVNIDKHPLKATDIAWNVTTSSPYSLAISLGSTNTTDNITRGAVLQWEFDSIDHNDLCSNELPSHEVELTSHLSCISAHAEKKNVWGVGSTYGELMIVDFSVADGKNPVVACSKIGRYTHAEPICSVSWFRVNVDSEWTLCSLGVDGRIIIWDSSLTYPVKCIPMRKNGITVMGRAMNVRQSTRLQNGSIIVGSSGGSVFAHDITQPKKHAMRIKGCEMKWSANALTMISRVDQKQREDAMKKVESRAKNKKRKGINCLAVLDAKLPFDMLFPSSSPNLELRSHAGQVTVIDVNPFHPNVFVTAGVDGAIKICDSNLKCIVLEFYLPCPNATDICSLPVIDAKFSPTRGSILAFASKKGVVFIWDISESVDFPVEQFKVPVDEIENNDIVSISFCNAQTGLLAVADNSGNVHFLRLPDFLCRPCRNTENLERILGLK